MERISELRKGIIADVPYGECERVIDLFTNGEFDLLHIAAHGAFDPAAVDNSGIRLSDGALRPSDLHAKLGLGTSRTGRPLIFLNACHGARAGFAVTGVGGWADRFVTQSRVGAFVGAAWEVNDDLAVQFAKAFYGALLREGKTFGESLQVAREEIRAAAPWNSTWLAYVLYADPQAHAVTPAA